MDEKELAAFVDNEELEINKDVNTVSEGPTLKVEKKFNGDDDGRNKSWEKNGSGLSGRGSIG